MNEDRYSSPTSKTTHHQHGESSSRKRLIPEEDVENLKTIEKLQWNARHEREEHRKKGYLAKLAPFDPKMYSNTLTNVFKIFGAFIILYFFIFQYWAVFFMWSTEYGTTNALIIYCYLMIIVLIVIIVMVIFGYFINKKYRDDLEKSRSEKIQSSKRSLEEKRKRNEKKERDALNQIDFVDKNDHETHENP